MSRKILINKNEKISIYFGSIIRFFCRTWYNFRITSLARRRAIDIGTFNFFNSVCTKYNKIFIRQRQIKLLKVFILLKMDEPLSCDSSSIFLFVRQVNQPITAPKKNAGGSISFLPTSCRFAKVCYFYVGKKEYSFSATN